MADLDIDIAELRQRAMALRITATRLRAVQAEAEEIAGVVGNASLANKVKSFGSGWSISKGKLVDQIDMIAQMLESIAESFDNIDKKMTSSIMQGRQ